MATVIKKGVGDHDAEPVPMHERVDMARRLVTGQLRMVLDDGVPFQRGVTYFERGVAVYRMEIDKWR